MPDEIAYLNDMAVHYHVAGHGPDVLMVHGWGSSRRMWTHFLADLTPGFRCWSLDLPGFGDSDKPETTWFSIPNYTLTLRRFVESRGLGPVRVVGHSMGGLISLDFTADWPAGVERLVVINPVVTGRPYLRPLAEWAEGAAILTRTQALSRRLLQPVLEHSLTAALPPRLRPYQRRMQDFAKATGETLLGAGRAIVDYDVLPRLGGITTPTLVILGALDANVPNSEGHLAAVEIPGARLAVLAAGHLVTDDRPAETSRLLRDFLA